MTDMNTAATTEAPLGLSPEPSGKGEYRLGEVRMPDGPGQREGAHNQLEIAVRYMKDGMHRQGRGIYLVVTGCTVEGYMKSHMLMQDPSVYLLLEPAKRLSAKRLAEVAEAAPTSCRAVIDEQVARARAYYAQREHY